jgi:predicted double-glycine peptidase
MHSARQRGIAAAIIQKEDIYKYSDGIDSNVAVVHDYDMCDDCRRLYYDPKTGNPKIFKLKELLDNEGSNYRRPWRQNAKPVLPPAHPHCYGRLHYVPAGWGWDDQHEFTLLDPAEAYPEVVKGKILDVPSYRQKEKYTCGPSAFLAVLEYYKFKDVPDEKKLAEALGSTEEGGTRPEDIEKLANKCGLKASIQEPMEIDDLEKLTDDGVPVIVAMQAWRDTKATPWASDWDDGHYEVVIGVDKDEIHFEDPSVSKKRAFIHRDEFLKRWHDVDRDGKKRIHLGIVIRP